MVNLKCLCGVITVNERDISLNSQVYELRSVDVGRLTGYSTQQIRDLERLGCLPPATRGTNGYRRFGQPHVTAARAYRALAAAIGPLEVRRIMPVLLTGTVDAAAEQVDRMHAEIAQARARVHEARRAMDAVRHELRDHEVGFEDGDAMTIQELARALDVRASTLRHWEDEGLLQPDRVTTSRARQYLAAAIADARIIASLRAGGYRIPEIREVVDELRLHGDRGRVHRALDARLEELRRRSLALLRGAGDLHTLLTSLESAESPRS